MDLPADRSPLLESLAELDAAHPVARKLLVGPDVNWGRELLVTLARASGGWIGWEAATLRSLADEIAFVPLAERHLRIATDAELAVLAGRALDRAATDGRTTPAFAALAGGLGFRTAVRDALGDLRVTGIRRDRLTTAAGAGTPARDLASVLEAYEAELSRAALADPASVFAAGIAAFDDEAPFVLGDALVVLAPELRATGLPGRLLDRLLARGATPLPVCPTGVREMAAARLLAARAVDASVPAAAPLAPDVSVDLFHAATPTDEIREVLRRILAAGLRWDEVELITTDPDGYGIALDALCRRLDIPYTALAGLPLARTRIGRALTRWLDWLADGLPADPIREALEAGDLGSPDADVPPPALARLLRQLAVAWGRARWDDALAELRGGKFAGRVSAREGEDDIARAARIAARRRGSAALAALLERLLAATPPVPERGADGRSVRVMSSASVLARSTLAYIELVPWHGQAERQTLDRLQQRLRQIADAPALGAGKAAGVPFGLALAELRDALSDVRAWPAHPVGRKPWSSDGGALHLTDIAHAGGTGRRHVFALGLDADRTAGPRVQDPFVNDALRTRLAEPALATTAERDAEREWLTQQALARLRGRVTLSFALAGGDGRTAGPAPLLLAAFRQKVGKPGASYTELRDALGLPASAVPAAPLPPLDERESWLGALADGPVLRDGERVVRAAWQALDNGLVARALRDAPALGAVHGFVPAAAGRHDPSLTGRPISPTSLELLAKCPLAWFYQYVLRLSLPDDPEYDPERWLDASQRGVVLHSVYEAVGRLYVGRQRDLLQDDAPAVVLAEADTLIQRWRDDVPPPSEAVFASESEELRQAALAFLDKEREAVRKGQTAWKAFELEFGAGELARYPLGDARELLLRGRVDRVDETPARELVVIDYKTGKPGRFEQKKEDGPFKGGRTLQAAIYAAAVQAKLGQRVLRFEYRFPTARGENRTVVYGPPELAAAPEILRGLLSHTARGEFIPTDDAGDCTYCDHQTICRTRPGKYDTVSPRAKWAADHGKTLDAYRALRARRSPAGEGA